jgi:23S rRNA U2552 (ribose-2'-O)-methylase RlmE/FtsJ
MAVFKCNISGNTMEVHTALDIQSMEVHPGYTLVEEKAIEEEVFDDIVVKKKKTKKKNQEL